MFTTVARLVSLVALVGTLLPAVLLLAGRLDLSTMKWWMLVATAAWFVATPLWMEREEASSGAASKGAGE